MLKFRAIALFIAVITSVGAQSGWSVRAQEDRIKREDEAFVRKLPKDTRKQQRALMVQASRPYAERILDGWSPSYESKSKPGSFKLSTDTKIAGRWKKMQGRLGSAFRITAARGAYQVKFATWDGKGSETFSRKGTLKGAVLQLDRPIFDVVEQPFSKIYVVKVGKETRLLPSADVALLDKLASTPNRSRAISGLTFRRV